MLPTSFMRCGRWSETPCASPNETARSEVSIAVMRSPPRRVKLCRLATPESPSPGRVSSVESMTRLGVSSVFFQGRGLPYIGTPATTDSGERPTGAKTITSYGVQVRIFRGVLRADVVVRDLQLVEGH